MTIKIYDGDIRQEYPSLIPELEADNANLTDYLSRLKIDSAEVSVFRIDPEEGFYYSIIYGGRKDSRELSSRDLTALVGNRVH